MTVSDDSVPNFPVKEEPHPLDAEPVTIFASTQSASPSIAIKGEAYPCLDDNCLDCLEALQTDQNDSDEKIVDAPVNASIAPVSNSCVTPKLKRSIPCPECGKTFASKAHLTIHLRVHTGERPYVCGQCPKAFNQLGTLKRHQAIHQAVRVRPFLCTAEGCGKAFQTKGELTVHFRKHTGERPYKCDSCGKAFIRGSELTRHLRRHTGERPYQCPLCPKAFAQSASAKYHQQTVHPTFP